ncbi:Gfo/Idh/MocA family protein [Paenibacillus dauci]|uniref:Gfo/Idh/MocA family protein n=1 Tax=Paenibacillus dauci TaxID=1567106 RepID=UPI000619201B|nr:Gfo/Idh/MocA family oxidoreductase [Paenibacillus dauci]
MKRMKAGLVGCGNISAIYFKNLKSSPVVEIVACADMVIEKAKERAEEFGIVNVFTPEELMQQEDIELIINLTIPAAHASVNQAALAAGKHVYAEKPFAVSLDDGRRTLEKAKEAGKRVGSAPDTFLGAGIETARHAIESGLIGRPIAASAFMMGAGPESWHPDPEFFYAQGGGPMFDMGPYYLTALASLLGSMTRVSSSAGIQMPDRVVHSGPKAGTPIRVQTPTHLAGTVDFENGAIATMVTSFDIPGGSQLPRMEIYGTAGTLDIPDPNFFDGDVRLRRAASDEYETLPPVFEPVNNDRGKGVNEMVQAIQENRPHRASGELAYHVLEVMHAFQRSSLEGKHVIIQSRAGYRQGSSDQ